MEIRRRLRVIYLYLVLMAAASTTLIFSILTGFELLRRAFGYEDLPNTWTFLVDYLPPLLVGSTVWAYHWIMVRQQASLFDRGARVKGALVWPRRPAIAALSFIGLVTAAAFFTSLLWLGIDWLLTPHEAIGRGEWWRDQLSASVAGGLVGCAIWLPAWPLLSALPLLIRNMSAQRPNDAGFWARLPSSGRLTRRAWPSPRSTRSSAGFSRLLTSTRSAMD